MGYFAKPPPGSLLKRTHPLANGLVGAWLFNEGAGNRCNDAVGVNHGTRTNMEDADWQKGYRGSVLNFDSSEFVKVDYSPSLFLSPEMTVCFWAKCDSTNFTSNGYAVSMYDYASGNRCWAIYGRASTNEWAVNVSDNGTTISTGLTAIPLSTTWHHFAFRFNNSAATCQVYYDGEYNTNLGFGGRNYVDQQSFLTIGGLETASFFDGKIESVLLYDRALSFFEIHALYRNSYQMWRRPQNPWYTWNTAGGPSQSIVPGLMSQFRRRRLHPCAA